MCKKYILVLAGFFLILLFHVYSFAEEKNLICSQEILSSSIMPLFLPIKSEDVHQREVIIAPDERAMLFKFPLWFIVYDPVYDKKGGIESYVLRTKGSCYKKMIRPKGLTKKISNKQFIKEREYLKSVDPGIMPITIDDEDDDNKGSIELVKSEFWMYKIRESQWIKLDYLKGDKLFYAWGLFEKKKKNSRSAEICRRSFTEHKIDGFGGFTSFDDALEWMSYDNTKIVGLRQVGEKVSRFLGQKIGSYGIYKLGVFCLDGVAERLFDVIKTGEATSLFCKWSYKGKFVLIEFGYDSYLLSFK